MNDDSQREDQSLSLTLLEQIHRASVAFEAACKAGSRPQIEQYLGDCDEPERPASSANSPPWSWNIAAGAVNNRGLMSTSCVSRSTSS